MRHTRAWCTAAGALLAAWACSQNDSGSPDRIGRATSALSATAWSVLGFEDHTLWSGATENSPVHSQGTLSAVVPVAGWTEVTSLALATLGPVDDTLRVDVWLPAEAQYWGEVRVIVKSPSLQEWYRDLGGVSLVGRTAGAFHTLEFAIVPSLAGKLAEAYDDLTITVVIAAGMTHATLPRSFPRSGCPCTSPGTAWTGTEPGSDPSTTAWCCSSAAPFTAATGTTGPRRMPEARSRGSAGTTAGSGRASRTRTRTMVQKHAPFSTIAAPGATTG